VETGALSVGHAKALLQLANPERRRHLRDRIVGEQLSVRASEELARSLAGPGASRRKQAKRQEAVDPNLRHLVDSLRDHLKTKVRIQGSPQRGTIEIEFYGPEELNRITSALLSDPRGL
jgi:ParB family chromosome partitioning protein